MNQLAQAALLGALASATTSSVIEWTQEDDPAAYLEENDFAIISFFNEEEYSIAVDRLMEGAKLALDSKMADGVWPQRSVGWYRVDLTKHPELSADGSGIADQMVYNKAMGLRRFIHYEKTHEDDKEAEEHLALIVRELTGEWFVEIDCEDIQAESRFFYDEVVYFGDAADLEEGGAAELLNSMSQVDRYNFDHQRVGFYYNTDPECRTAHDLEAEKKYIVYFNGENSIPYHLTVDEDYINFEQLMFTLNTSIVKGTPRWSQRSYSSLYDFYMNGLIFLMEEGALRNVVTSKDDWRVALMAQITEWTQEYDSTFVPIIGQFDDNDESIAVPSIAQLLQADRADVPHIYVLHSLTGQSIKYPEKLEDVNQYSPELIIAWAEKAVIEADLAHYQAEIDWVPEKDEDGKDLDDPLTEEDRSSLQEVIDALKERLEAAVTEHDQIKEGLKVKNEFVENLEEHFDVSESHMTRIEQAHMEDEL